MRGKLLEKGCGKCEVEDGKFVCHSPKDSVTCFWANSINGTSEKFDFEKNSKHFKNRLRGKLAEHGLLGEGEFVESKRGIYGQRDELEQWTQHTSWITIDKNDLRDVLNEYTWERNKETFEDNPTFVQLKETYEKTEDMGDKPTSKKVSAFDSLIHAQHETGQVVEEVNVEELREEFEEEIK